MRETFISSNMLEAWYPTWEWCLRHLSVYKVAFTSLQTITLDCQSGLTLSNIASSLSRIKHQEVVINLNTTTRCTTRACHHIRWTLVRKINQFQVALVIQEWFLVPLMDKPSKDLRRYPLIKTSIYRGNILNNSSHRNSIVNISNLREECHHNLIKVTKVNTILKDSLIHTTLKCHPLVDLWGNPTTVNLVG